MSFRIVPSLTQPMRAVVEDARPLITNIARRSRANYARFSDMVFIAIARAGGEGFGHDERSETGEVASVMISSRAEVAGEAKVNPLFAIIARALGSLPADPEGLQPTLVVSDLVDTWVGLAGAADVSIDGLLDGLAHGSERLARIIGERQAEVRAAIAASGARDPGRVVAFVQAGDDGRLDVRIMGRSDMRAVVAPMVGSGLMLPWLDEAPGDGKLSVVAVGCGVANCTAIPCGLLPGAASIGRVRCDDLELRTTAVSAARAIRALHARWSKRGLPSTLCLVVSTNPVVSAWLIDLMKTVAAPPDAVARVGGATAFVLWQAGLERLRVAHLTDSVGLLDALAEVGGSASDPALLVCGPRSFAAGRCAAAFGILPVERALSEAEVRSLSDVLRERGPAIVRQTVEAHAGGPTPIDRLVACATLLGADGAHLIGCEPADALRRGTWKVAWMTRDDLLETGIGLLDGMSGVEQDVRAPFDGSIPVVMSIGSALVYQSFPIALGTS